MIVKGIKNVVKREMGESLEIVDEGLILLGEISPSLKPAIGKVTIITASSLSIL